jgi:hypothetical protein
MPTGANTYGGTAHLSPLLRKVEKLGFRTPNALLRLAVRRGCTHYALTEDAHDPPADPGLAALSNIELGMAMISGAQDFRPQLMRCAAQLFSDPAMEVGKLVRLARMERCVPMVAYIARHARQWDTGREAFWAAVLAALPRPRVMSSSAWPHPSRFMLQAGYQRGGGVPRPVWLRPRPPQSS